MRRRTVVLAMVGVFILTFLISYFRVGERMERSAGLDPNSPRVKQAGNGIIIELPEEEDDD